MRVSRALTPLAALLVWAAGGLVLPASSAAAAEGRCAAGTGVTVIVDYGPLGGTEVGCDPNGAGVPAKTVVPRAGFPLTYVGQGFVCRIKGLPDASKESCNDTPPEDAYWALYWSDGTSQSWKYSSSGVSSLSVPKGGSIGWRFQDGGSAESPSEPPNASPPKPTPQPSADPSPQPSKPPKTADPTPTPTQTPSASLPPEAGDPGSSPVPEAEPEGQGAKGPGDDKGKKGSGSGKDKDKGGDKDEREKGKEKERPGPSFEETAVPSDSSTVAMLEPASDEPNPGNGSSAVLTLVAGGAVLLLVGAAGVIAWRRRA